MENKRITRKMVQNISPMTNKCLEINDISEIIFSSLKRKIKNLPLFGLEDKLKEFEKWIRQKNEKNSPLIFLTRKNEYQSDFIISLIHNHLDETKKIFKNIFLPIFVSPSAEESSLYYIIYNTLIKLRRIFNIKRRVDLSPEKLRLNFLFWLDLISRKIQTIKYFDGDLVIIIESAHLIRDSPKNIEYNLKFWIPTNIPSRIKILITLQEDSYNLKYFRGIGSRIIYLMHTHININQFFEYQKNQIFVLVI